MSSIVAGVVVEFKNYFKGDKYKLWFSRTILPIKKKYMVRLIVEVFLKRQRRNRKEFFVLRVAEMYLYLS